MPGDSKSPGPSSGGRGRIAALILVAVLAIALYGISRAVVGHNAMQNCIDSGRRDCDTRVGQ